MGIPQQASEFLARHARHPYIVVVQEAVALGRCENGNVDHLASCDEALSIYQTRAEHLARYATSHAIDLRGEVLDFCEKLGSCSGQKFRWWLFRLENGVRYAFAEHAETRALLGALRTVSKLHVSTDDWSRLWGDVV
jgi:hypothetical protein